MDWIRTHPYLTTSIAACTALFFGGLVVLERTQSVSPVGVTTWATDSSGVIDVTSGTPSNSSQNQTLVQASIINQALNNYSAPNYKPPAATTTSTSQIVVSDSSSFDYNAFLATLTQSATPPKNNSSTTTSQPSNAFSAYSFIPTGMISTTTSYTQQRTPTQDALYQYGNEAGSYIQSYEKFHTDTTNVLQDQIADRNNPDKIAAVQKIGQDLQDLGTQLSGMTEVPDQVTAAHNALAASYTEIGQNLVKVPSASYDSDFVNAIKTYDASADTFTKHFVTLAMIFSAYGVKFGPEDPGSVFTFTQSSI